MVEIEQGVALAKRAGGYFDFALDRLANARVVRVDQGLTTDLHVLLAELDPLGVEFQSVELAVEGAIATLGAATHFGVANLAGAFGFGDVRLPARQAVGE